MGDGSLVRWIMLSCTSCAQHGTSASLTWGRDGTRCTLEEGKLVKALWYSGECSVGKPWNLLYMWMLLWHVPPPLKQPLPLARPRSTQRRQDRCWPGVLVTLQVSRNFSLFTFLCLMLGGLSEVSNWQVYHQKPDKPISIEVHKLANDSMWFDTHPARILIIALLACCVSLYATVQLESSVQWTFIARPQKPNKVASWRFLLPQLVNKCTFTAA